MKILFAHDHVFQIDKNKNIYTIGGFPSNVWERYLSVGNSINVIARSKEIYNVEKLKSAERIGVNFLFINGLNSFKNLVIPSFKIKDKIEKEVKESDLVIVRLPSEIGNLVYDIATKQNKKIVVEVVACVWDALWNYGDFKAKIYAPFAFYRMKKRIKTSKHNIYVTNKTLQIVYPSNGKSISCSNVELPYVDEKILEQKLAKEKDDTIKLGLIGNVGNKIKGIDVALKAIKILDEKGIKVCLEILGAGNQDIWNGEIEKLDLKNKVIFKGTLPSGEPVFKWLDTLDIYIQPSYQEGLPRAVIEAMSRGLPIAVSNAGGCGELINKELVHKKGNYKELAKHLEILINDNKFMKKQMEINFNNSAKYLKKMLFTSRKDFLRDVQKGVR